MLTIADPNYSPRGGYLFESNIPNDTMINGASWSCRPLDNIVAMVSHLNQEKARSHMVEQWLEKEHKFAQKGYLPHIAMKLGQFVNISILVREISNPTPKDMFENDYPEWTETF
ncbi:hypothetical protein F66182_17806 [Fusarium sp. NRRL 66182]|nr:hypothetical protein F66182_17806 [Fusarium sp. NRRL 66182]